MASTYVPIATYTVSGSSTPSYTFTSIPATYTDLVLVGSGAGTADIDISCRVNSSTNYYSRTMLTGNGSSASSARGTTQAQSRLTYAAYWQTTGISNFIAHFMNYANTTTYKTFISRANNAALATDAIVNLWSQTSAISSIEVYTSSNNFASGSTFTLYGIKAA